MKKCVLICNPNSGHKNRKDLLTKFQTILNEYNYDAKIEYTKYAGHAERLVAELPDNLDLVISLGGDGTCNEVVTGNLNRKKPLLLAHIPLGTTNDLGAMFGMGKNPEENLKMTLNGTVKNIDICKINNHPFVYVAGLGKFVDVAYDTPRNLKKNFGYFAYLINGFKSFNQKTKLFEMTYEVNGETTTGLYSLVLIGNATRMAGLQFFQNVKLDDGQFEVLLSNFRTKADLVRSLYYFKTSDITKAPGFYYFKTDHLKIKLKEPPRKEWCIDGEMYNEHVKEFDISIIKDFKMLIPKKNIDKIFVK